jgi:hypothetical protein
MRFSRAVTRIEGCYPSLTKGSIFLVLVLVWEWGQVNLFPIGAMPRGIVIRRIPMRRQIAAKALLVESGLLRRLAPLPIGGVEG